MMRLPLSMRGFEDVSARWLDFQYQQPDWFRCTFQEGLRRTWFASWTIWKGK